MEKCYNCKGDLNGIYQVMIYEDDLKFVNCCSEDCANYLKSSNASSLYRRFESVDRQSIQVLKKEDLSVEKRIERYKNKIKCFIEDYEFDFSVEEVLNSYKNKFMKGYSVGFSMTLCIETFESEIRFILKNSEGL